MSGGRFIDLETWKRRQHYELFRHAAQPFFSVTVTVDVSGWWRRCQADESLSFSLAAIFAMLRAANGSEPLRLRLRGDRVWLHDRVGTGTTVLRADETFGFARLDPGPAFDAFCRAARPVLAEAKQPGPLDAMHDVDDLIYHSTLPWLRFTAFSNALPGGDDSIPRVVFGGVFADGEAFRMPVGVEVHHALVDGLDVARFLESFQAHLDE